MTALEIRRIKEFPSDRIADGWTFARFGSLVVACRDDDTPMVHDGIRWRDMTTADATALARKQPPFDYNEPALS